MKAPRSLRFFYYTLFITALSQPIFALSPLKEVEDRREVSSEAILQALHSSQSQQRINAVIALGRIQKPEGIDLLFDQLEDSNPAVRKEAIFSLGQFAWSKSFSNGREAEITEKIALSLKSENPEIRKAAVESIGKIGLEKTPLFVAPFLKDTHASVRAASIIALYRYRLLLKMRENTTPALLNETDMQNLLALAGDSHKEVRKSVAYYFSKVKDERGKEAILSLIYSPDVWTRFFATNALSKLNMDEEIITAILSATEDENYSVRSAAVQAAAFFKIGDKLGPALRGDPSFHVRIAYVQALTKLFIDNNVTEELLTATKTKLEELYLDSNLSVKAEALKALAQIKSNSNIQALINDSLQSTEWVLRVAAVEASKQLNSSLKEEIFKTAATDNDVRVRVSALESLASEENYYAYKLIQHALDSKELSERGTAVASLQSRKENTRFADAFEAYKKSQEEKWVELREEIVKLWESENSIETNQFLREAVLDKSPSVAHLAATTLQERGITDFPEPNNKEEFSFSPYRELTFKRNPKLFLETKKGILTLELYPKQAPLHVANMVGFAQEGKYNGLPIHRVVSNFVIQGGDPDKSGWGSAGYSLRAEINHLPFERGSVGMPRSMGFDTGSVQFFINHVPTPHLDGQYTVFGKVIDNLEVIDQSEVGDVILKSWVEY